MRSEAYGLTGAKQTPDLVVTKAQQVWLQDSRDAEDSSLSPKVMYPRLLGGRGGSDGAYAPKGVIVSEVVPYDYFQQSPRNLSTTYSSVDQLEVEYSEPSADLDALLKFLDDLIKVNARLTEVTYIVNSWKLGGLIPLKHHGFVFKAEGHGFLTLDFSRRGIL